VKESGVTVGVVNYDGRDYLARTLDAVSLLGPAVDQVLLIDNGSTDGSIAFVRQRFPSVHVVALGENPGPGAARNVILREARNPRVLLIDNDVAPQPGCVEALSDALDAHPRAVIAMPAIIHSRAPHLVQYAGAEAHFMGTMALCCAEYPVESLDRQVRAVGSLVSAALLLDRDRFREPCFFDEAFFFYLEDHELGLRCKLMDLDLLSVPVARCLHDVGTVGVSIRQTGRFTPVRVRFTVRNRWQILLKLYQWRTLLRFAPALAAFEAFQFCGAARQGWLLHWFWAAGSTVANLPDLLRRRHGFQRLRRRDDLDVLVAGPFPFNPAMHKGGMERAARRALDWIARWNWRLMGRRQ
jgi:GT2 family glycosyltransferase